MRCVNKLQDLGKIAGISILAMLLRYFYINSYLFGGEEILITETGTFQLYFGGLLLEQSFDLIALSLQMLIVILETVMLVSDLHNGMIENIDILICRVSNKRGLYRNFIGQVMLRNMILIAFDYSLFVLLEKTKPCSVQISILLTLFLQIVLLELVYFTIDFAFKIVYGYIFMLLLYFSPVIFIGFMYANGSDLWHIGKRFWFQYGIYNWFHNLSVVYVESSVKWDTVSYQITDSNTIINLFLPSFVTVILSLCLYAGGKICFQKSEII